jgi:ketosteroid isomerase-like protein
MPSLISCPNVRSVITIARLAAAALAAAFLLAPAARADSHYEDKADAVAAGEKKLAAEITAFLEAYESAYDNQDYRTVKSMWLDDGQPIYMAEEVPFPLYGRERLDKYFNPAPGRRILDGIDNRYSEVRAKYLAPDLAVATYRLDYDIKLVGQPAVRGWDRVMAVFARKDGRWLLTAYAEAPMGPATMVRRMMKEHPPRTEAEKAAHATTTATIKALAEAGVSPGFASFIEERADLAPKH